MDHVHALYRSSGLLGPNKSGRAGSLSLAPDPSPCTQIAEVLASERAAFLTVMMSVLCSVACCSAGRQADEQNGLQVGRTKSGFVTARRRASPSNHRNTTLCSLIRSSQRASKKPPGKKKRFPLPGKGLECPRLPFLWASNQAYPCLCIQISTVT